MTKAYPLQWPEGKKRNYAPCNSQFKTSLSQASSELFDELHRLGAANIVLSSNMKYREDGIPYARQPNIDDTGVAIYFTYRGNQMCFACDKYTDLKDNVRAIGLTIQAIRGIERWGSSDMMQQAFKGFEALPSPENHWDILGITPTGDTTEINTAYRNKCKTEHPDKGGTITGFHKLKTAYDTAISEATK